MASAKPDSLCPFCGAEVPTKACVCPSCLAQKQSRKSMSPLGFRAYAVIWLACSGALVAAALYLALLPWLPERDAPPYALRLVGAAPLQQARCTVEVIADPRAPVVTREVVPCAPGQASASATQSPQAPAAATRRRLAAALHGVLVLSLAGLLSWFLRRALRALFLRPSGTHWVRRSA